MSVEAGTAGATVSRTGGLRERITGPFTRSEALRGYGLISPTLIVMVVAMGMPIGRCIAYSFWTQDYPTIDRTFTLADYQEAVTRPLYRQGVWDLEILNCARQRSTFSCRVCS